MATSQQALPGGLGSLAQLKELRQRLLFVLFALFVFRVCSFIPVPGINPEAMAQLFDQQSGTIIDMFNMFSGGHWKDCPSLLWGLCLIFLHPLSCSF